MDLTKQYNQDIKDVKYNKQNKKTEKTNIPNPLNKMGGWTVSDPSNPNKSDKCKFAIKSKSELSNLQKPIQLCFAPKMSL